MPDAHLALESEIASFLGVESAMLCSQSFAAVTSVIPSFAKRGDVIVADRGCSFAIQRGIQLSRSTVIWFEHGDMASLERTLAKVTRVGERRKEAKLTRRFVVTEGLFENDGSIADLEAIVSRACRTDRHC